MLHLIDFVRNKHPEYIQLGLSSIPENAVIITVDGENHSTVFFHLLYEPQIVGIILPKSLLGLKDFGRISTFSIIEKSAQIDFNVSFESDIHYDDQTVLLFKVIAVGLHAGFLKRWYINRFLQRALIKNDYVIKQFNAMIFDTIISFFVYPKPVFVISTQSENSNSFPVDTCRKVGSRYLFGVRASNKIMSEVNLDDFFFIGISDFSKKQLVYQLGKYNDAKNKVSYRKDNRTEIMIPEVSSACDLVVLENIIRYENQSVFVARIISETIPPASVPFLAHIHKSWLLSKSFWKAYF